MNLSILKIPYPWCAFFFGSADTPRKEKLLKLLKQWNIRTVGRCCEFCPDEWIILGIPRSPAGYTISKPRAPKADQFSGDQSKVKSQCFILLCSQTMSNTHNLNTSSWNMPNQQTYSTNKASAKVPLKSESWRSWGLECQFSFKTAPRVPKPSFGKVESRLGKVLKLV